MAQGKPNVDELLDDILDFFLVAYLDGSQDAAEMLGIKAEPDFQEAKEAITKKIAGKNYEERVREYASSGDAAEIVRVIDTDMTRIYNTAVLNTAKQNGGKRKTWVTMMDNRVRDTHSPLEGVTIPLDAEFYTWDGDHAEQPGGFTKASNNVNCRCVLTVS